MQSAMSDLRNYSIALSLQHICLGSEPVLVKLPSLHVVGTSCKAQGWKTRESRAKVSPDHKTCMERYQRYAMQRMDV